MRGTIEEIDASPAGDPWVRVRPDHPFPFAEFGDVAYQETYWLDQQTVRPLNTLELMGEI